MSAFSRSLTCFFAFLILFVSSSTPLFAQDKKDPKKDEKKVEPKKDDKKEEPKVIDLTKEKRDTPLREMKGHASWIESLAFGPDNKLLSTSKDRTVKVWDAGSGKELQTFKDQSPDVKAVFVSGDQLAGTAGKWDAKKKAWEGEIKIFDIKTGKEVQSLKGHSEPIECLAVSKDGKTLASGSDDHTIKIWDVASGKETRTIKAHAGAVLGLSFSPDGKHLASAGKDKAVRVWDLLASATAVPKEEPKKAEPVKEEPKKTEPKKDDPKPDVKKDDPKKKDEMKKKDDTKKKEEPAEKLDTPVREFKSPGREFTCVAYSPHGKSLAAGNLDGLVKVWTYATLPKVVDTTGPLKRAVYNEFDVSMELSEFKANQGIWTIAWSPDGSKIAAGGWDWAVYIIDPANGKQLKLIQAHQSTITVVAFSPDGQLLATGGLDNVIRVWELK